MSRINDLDELILTESDRTCITPFNTASVEKGDKYPDFYKSSITDMPRPYRR